MSKLGIPAIRLFGLAVGVGAFFTIQAVTMALVAGAPVDWPGLVLQELLYWLVWAALAPLLVAGALRWPIDGRPRWKPVTIHVALSVVAAPIQTAIAFGLHRACLRALGLVGAGDPWLALASGGFAWGAFMGVFFYWLVSGIVVAVRLRQRYLEAELASAEQASRNAALESQLTRSQLDALRSQLQPHFLFNTLNAISTLTTEDPATARTMVIGLGSLLRRSLEEERHEVPLARELSFVSEYLDIQRMRFGDRLSVTMTVEPAAAGALVPVFLLQPLVENALEHGADPDGTATVEVTATADRSTLRLTVADGGTAEAPEPVVEGIGLRNTRERLQRLYPGRATLELRRGHGPVGERGSCVAISMPLTTAP